MLRKLISYDPETGQMTWLNRPRHLFTSDREFKRWNKRYAGKPALAANHKNGYLHGHVNKKPVLAHRAAWSIHYGSQPPKQIDHKNGDRKDNRIENLRDGTGNKNARNAKMRSDNTTGKNGIYYKRGAWLAMIGVDGKMLYLGSFRQKEQAIAARNAAETMLGYAERHGKKETKK